MHMKCRHCDSELTFELIDLGAAPPSNAYLTPVSLRRPEKWFPLRVLVCEICWLVQAESYSRAAELFNDEYAYFSSFSDAWLDHSKRYVESAVSRFGLGKSSLVIEIASNDGYLLQYVQQRKIPCIGIEPTASTASASRMKGIETIERFFGTDFAKSMRDDGKSADLMVANNVLAHVPDINDFVRAFSILLKDDGVATFEFPHLLKMIMENQFDTIYHEHFSYLSFTTVCEIFSKNGLEVFDVEEIGTHGGSLRVFSQKTGVGKQLVSPAVGSLLQTEDIAGMKSRGFYERFSGAADLAKLKLLDFLCKAKSQNKIVVAYGAAAKGNTMLNFAGVRSDLISFVVDRNPSKQGKWLPGSRIPILDEGQLMKSKPDYILILPWNLQKEIVHQLGYARDWGAKFVVVQPEFSEI